MAADESAPTRHDLNLIRAFTGWTDQAEQDMGRFLAARLRDALPEMGADDRAHVLLQLGRLMSEIAPVADDASGIMWANAILIAAAHQDY